ncbi:MAG: nitrate reductase subunit beta [Deltaproteobacteria bacterium]|nr:MAG: nitrate reductase subunit beta [Deltaproteobacteria bacterium]
MDVRSQVSMVFHLDKCIGCHTCSIACKNVWTDRKGAEYMWWNNVETKPGTGYPTAWEDQEKYKGGFERPEGNGRGIRSPKLRAVGKVRGALTVFHNPNLPTIDDYYEPFTYRYDDLFTAPEGADQPTARAVSMITGEEMNIEAGPNWDDDLGGSPVYAANDPNLANCTPEERAALFEAERLVFFYLPRICNHCMHPACVAACPSGALYKRGEDGIVLLNQERCRAWRFCVTACPYKKTYFNWSTGKSEKCILCYPRLESGQAPACFHSCVGRIRYLGMVLYDADRIPEALAADDKDLVERQRELLLDPRDPKVIAAARANGIRDDVIEHAQRSPVYDFVINWGLALPLHAEHRTLPMLFYVPPMLPVMANRAEGKYDTVVDQFLGGIDEYRLPLKYLASLFGAGNEAPVRYALRKQLAVRTYRRALTVGDVDMETAKKVLAEADCSVEEADRIYHLTSIAPFDERFVIPPMHREEAIEMLEEDTLGAKGFTGLGFRRPPERGL